MFELKLRVFPHRHTHTFTQDFADFDWVSVRVCLNERQVEINNKPLEKLEEGREDAHTNKEE